MLINSDLQKFGKRFDDYDDNDDDDDDDDDDFEYYNDGDHLTSPFVSIWLNSSSANTADTNSD